MSKYGWLLTPFRRLNSFSGEIILKYIIMYCIFEINFNRAQQKIKINTASVRNIFFLMKSTEILSTMMYSSTYKLKGDILAKSFLYIQIVHSAEV